MKKFYLITFLLLTAAFISKAQIQMNSSGNVSIGSSSPSSTFKLVSDGPAMFKTSGTVGYGLNFVEGYATMTTLQPYNGNYGNLGSSTRPFYKIFSSNVLQISDIRQKENIRNITGALDCILNLTGWKYDLKMEILNNGDKPIDPDLKNKLDADRKDKLGLLAQDVLQVLPEAVYYDSISDAYAVYYNHFIPVLIEAIKEQHAEIEELKLQIINNDSHKSAKISSTPFGDQDIDQQATTLFQNAPNPFTQNTTIAYFLSENAQKAMICIYDMNGTQLKCIPLHLSGYGDITINGSEFKAGMYMYSLLADGQLFDTKKMILTN